MAARSAATGRSVRLARTPPSSTTWLTMLTPSAWSRKAAATAPSATRAAVSRAEARSRMGRASGKAYFCIPARSAWPGLGRVSGALRAWAASRPASTSPGAITVSHLGHSVFPIMMAIGEPRVSPCRNPPSRVTESSSNFMRAPRPAPRRLLAKAAEISGSPTRTWAGTPSIVAIRAWPCDSPAVR